MQIAYLPIELGFCFKVSCEMCASPLGVGVGVG